MTASGASFSQISLTLERLRQLTRVDVQTNWNGYQSDRTVSPVELNARRHIAWPRQQVVEFTQNIIVPTSLNNFPLTDFSLRLVLRWWAEDAQIYVNDQFRQAGDLFDCSTRVLLSDSVQPGDQFTVRLRLVSPKHDEGALVQSVCVYETLAKDRVDPGFIASELEVFLIAITQNPSYRNKRQEHLNFLTPLLDKIDWFALPEFPQKFDNSLIAFRQTLIDYISTNLPNFDSKIALLGHAHLDLAWLWPVAETWKAAENTFKSVLSLQQDFPNLIFTHSSPALYAWIETHHQDLFSQIQHQVQTQKWEIAAGLWVEPELNIISGESIVRQLLYGQLYTQEKFGQLSPIAWLPDSFGFCWQLPQLLKQAGINYFVTQKLRWNDTTQFPYSLFNWQSPDGTEIISYMSAPIGEGIDPIKMATYTAEWETQTGLKTALWLPGVGDHGGGPTRDMLEVAGRWQSSPFFPELGFSRAVDYLSEISQQCGELPVWSDELYLEFHRGCYTTHADQKRWNRRCEHLLYQAELWSAIATLLTTAVYPKAELEAAWKQVLFNQFHDILPGSAIPEVYQDANLAWMEVDKTLTQLRERALRAIAAFVTLPPPPQPDCLPILVWNSLNWSCSQGVELSLSSPETWRLYDAYGKALQVQVCSGKLRFLATDVPSVGFRLFWLGRKRVETVENSCSEAKNTPIQTDAFANFSTSIPVIQNSVNLNVNSPQIWVLENEFLKVEIASETGNISQIWDKKNQRQVLSEQGGNQLQFFEDSHQYWDGWNIDPNYKEHLLEPPQLQSISWQEQGEIQWRLQVIRVWRKSEFIQDYVLEANSPVLKIETRINWQERHVLVKAAFPLNLTVDFAYCEIPVGVIKRPTQPQTESEKAKWEIPAMNWVDLGDDHYGVSVLNDCKYGYDLQPNQMRLTLLRGSTWPDPEADLGIHQFTYAIYPHEGDWKVAKVTHRGYELNQPLEVQVLSPEHCQFSEQASGTQCFLDLNSDSLILMAFKQSEQNSQAWILRCYESQGEKTELKLNNQFGLDITHPVNLLEQPIESPNFPEISPWKIVTVQLSNNSELS
ncbi:alpha mannosidase, middle domain protein [Lyngbya aestuarii BL J]|mgnify:CR=1 FL=1|uniref:Alpha mannosidase, middle domain protein n=1 Tax=Lyngbya aestuarii BL J TaxID=1348334 RepID=U7QHA4_9CYAN|nr:alpha-mannosidase [Lyngbya aestuarii]ERT07278.1 alpha mannosidase, middle domain protein [Lyngbya aestuarii BL J]